VQAVQSLVNYNLKELEDCVGSVYKMLESVQYQEHLMAALKGQEIDYIGELLKDTPRAKIFFKFPRILEASLFITLYAFLEHTLIQLCGIIGIRGGYSLRVSDVKGRGVEAARIYIKKAAELPFPDESRGWRDIQIYRLIRNCIVHQDGRVSDNDRKLQEGIRRFGTQGLSVNIIGGEIELSKPFCIEFIRTMEEFLKTLFDGIAAQDSEVRPQSSGRP